MNSIKKAKDECWEQWLRKVNDYNMWKAADYISTPSTDASRVRVPTLVRTTVEGQVITADSNASKARMFEEEFFPIAPNNVQVNEEEHKDKYPEPEFNFEPITNDRIRNTISKLEPYKAPDTDKFSNSVLINCTDEVIPRIGPLFRVVHKLQYWPDDWKYVGTIVLHKPGKDDYTKPGSHRPISLIKKLAMLFSKCLSDDLLHHAERYNMLAPMQFGFRPGRSTTDAIQYGIAKIKDAWRQGKCTTMLLLDIKAAFPHIVITQLVHIMRSKGIPREYTDWIVWRFKGRKTRLQFDDYESNSITILDGLDQGNPFLTTGMLFYIDKLIRTGPDCKNGEEAIGFADDVNFISTGDDLEQAARKAEDFMHRTGGALDWSKETNCTFGLDKTACIGMTRRREADPRLQGRTRPITRPGITIGGVDVKMDKSAKWLGILIDQELRFNAHAAYALKKGTDYMHQYRRLARNANGVWHKYLKWYYKAIAMPRMLYGAEVWLKPPRISNKTSQKFMNKMATVQRQAALHATGALRTTPNNVLDAHANILPFDIAAHQVLHRCTLRLATLPKTHPLSHIVRRAARRYVKAHRTPLHELFHAYQIKPDGLETISSVRKGPRYEPVFKIDMASNKDKAKKAAVENKAEYQAFSDGSEIDGQVGAAAVLYRNGNIQATLRLHLGPATKYGIAEVELVGELMAVHLLTKIQGRYGEATIGADNTSTLHNMLNQKPRGAHYLMDEIHNRMEAAVRHRKTRRQIRMVWTPGHVGIDGNERADEEAKKAARGDQSAASDLPALLRKPLPMSRSAARKTYKAKTKIILDKQIRTLRQMMKIRSLDHRFKPATFEKTTNRLPRQNKSILIQLRTGHIGLAKHLHRIKKAASPICPGCRAHTETVMHYLLHCMKYRVQRQALHRDLGRKASEIRYLLTEEKALPALFRFIAATRRFHKTHGNLELEIQECRRDRSDATKGECKLHTV
jgi:ribonuclease HI